MSLNNLKKIILKAGTDSEFRNLFISNPTDALAKYELTDEEKECLIEMANREDIEKAIVDIQAAPELCANDIRL